MHDPRVVIRDGAPVVLIGGHISRQSTANEQCGTIETGSQPRSQRTSLSVRTTSEWARATTEYIGGGRLGKSLIAERELVGKGLHLPNLRAPLGLRVDSKRRAAVPRPDLIDVRLIVAREERGVEHDTVVGAQSAQQPPIWRVDNKRTPTGTINRSLRLKAGAYGCKAVSGHAGNVLSASRGVGQRQRDGQADKVDVTDIGEKLSVVEGKLGEAPRDVDVRVGGIRYGGLNERGSRIEQEGQGSID